MLGAGVAVETLVGVDKAVDDTDGVEEGAAGGVALASATVLLFTTNDSCEDGARAALPCPAANWLTMSATTSTLMPSPTPIAALPIV